MDLGGGSVEAQGERLVQELRYHSLEDEIGYRHGGRLVRGIEELHVGSGGRSRPIEGGFYVVIGGLGTVGRSVASRLVREMGARLLLVGRSPLDASAAEFLGSLPDAAYEPVDTSNHALLSAALARAEARVGRRVDGVVHVADAVQPRLLVEETEGSYCGALRAKLDGMAANRRVLAERPECQFVGFSSVISLLGGAEYGAYAAANCALEAATEALAATGSARRCSVAWSAWTGMGINREWEAGLREAAGLLAQGVSEGRAWHSLLAAFGSEEPVVLVGLDGGHAVTRRRLNAGDVAATGISAYCTVDPADGGRTPALSLTDRFGTAVSIPITIVRELPALGPGRRVLETGTAYAAGRMEPRDKLERSLVELWSGILDRESVGVNEDFFAIGGNSLSATQVATRLREQWRVNVSVRTLFDHPTVESLALEVLQLMVQQAGDDVTAQALAEAEGRA